MGIEEHFCGCQLFKGRVFLVHCFVNCWLEQIFDIHFQNSDSKPSRHNYMILPQLIIINQTNLMTALTGPKHATTTTWITSINDKVFEIICQERLTTNHVYM